VEKHYAVVGVLEELNKTLTVLEHYVPRYFKGAFDVYWNEVSIFSKINRNIYKPPVAEETKIIVRKNFTRELEFFDFCKQRLHKQYMALNLNPWYDALYFKANASHAFLIITIYQGFGKKGWTFWSTDLASLKTKYDQIIWYVYLVWWKEKVIASEVITGIGWWLKLLFCMADISTNQMAFLDKDSKSFSYRNLPYRTSASTFSYIYFLWAIVISSFETFASIIAQYNKEFYKDNPTLP